MHWFLVFKKDNKLYEFDSFGRDLLGARYKDVNSKDGLNWIQDDEESNCGQRTLAMIDELAL